MSEAAQSHPAFGDVSWLRALAARLARDSDEADDLVQETLIAAWRQAPEDRPRGLRPWLAGVLRNRSRMTQRSSERRRTRESSAVVSPPPTDAESVQARLEMVESLLGALRELSKEEQTLVVRRYFDDEAPSEIAASLNVPAATVRSRLRRSLHKLRSTLDERYGSRAAWAALAIPLPIGASSPTPPPSTTTMSIPLKLATIALTTTAIGTGGYFANQPSSTPATPAEATPSSVSETPTRTRIPTSPPTSEQRAAQPPSEDQKKWAQRRSAIQSALDQWVSDDAGEVDEAMLRKLAEHPSREAFRDALDNCTEEAKLDAALTVAYQTVGAPDIGTIFTSVDIVDHNIDDPQLRECITEFMYSYVGPAPEEPTELKAQITGTLRKKGERSAATLARAIAGAHSGEVRFCESKHPGSEGSLVLALEFSEPGELKAVRTTASAVSKELEACVSKAVGRWKFPAFDDSTVPLDFAFPMVRPAE